MRSTDVFSLSSRLRFPILAPRKRAQVIFHGFIPPPGHVRRDGDGRALLMECLCVFASASLCAILSLRYRRLQWRVYEVILYRHQFSQRCFQFIIFTRKVEDFPERVILESTELKISRARGSELSVA